MKITIIPSDGAVYKDGVSYSELSLTSVPSNIHAMQWDGVKGEIEFVTDANGNKAINEKIDALPDWVNDCLTAWDSAKIEEENLIESQPTVSGAQDL